MSASFRGILPMCLRLACAALLWVTASGLPAQAVVINVNGTDYDVQFLSDGFDLGNPSFDDNVATLTDPATAPWWGDPALALDFANAYSTYETANPGSFDVSGFPDFLAFAYQINSGNPANVDLFYVQQGGGVIGSTATRASSTLVGTYAYVAVPAAIPEIDGGALAKALFILFALGAWLEARRRRMA